MIKSVYLRTIMVLLLFSFLSGFLLIRRSTVQASPETVVEVLPSSNQANVGQTFTINVTIVDVQNLYGVEATVKWNSSILQLANFDIRFGQADGVLYNTIFGPFNSSQEGQLSVWGNSLPPALPFNGSGNIVRITFNVTNSGDCSIDLESKLQDYPPPDREPRISLPIDHSTVGGQFSTEVVEIPNSAIFLIFTVLTVSALVFSKKMAKKVRLRPLFDDAKQDLLTEGKA
jgi:hypothetical protein